MGEQNKKRMIGETGYEVKQSMWISGREILIAENMDAEDGQIYLVCNYKEDGIFIEYSAIAKSNDYLEAVQEFTGRINARVEKIRDEQNALNLPAELFTTEHCYPHSHEQGIEGKVVAVKASVFFPEYRRGDCQLVYVTGGHGAQPNARGKAVFCYHLNDGTHTRYERHNVLGEIRPECMPVWAKESLARLQGEMAKPAEEKEHVGSYEIMESIEAGNKVFVLGHSEKAPDPYGTWEGRKGQKDSFVIGHYFTKYPEAKEDLQDRAAAEQQRLNRHKRSERDSR